MISVKDQGLGGRVIGPELTLSVGNLYLLLAVVELNDYHLDTVLLDVASSIGPDSMLALVLNKL